MTALFSALWQNRGTISLSFVLAVVVWISAVIAEDPNQEGSYSQPLILELVSLDESLVVVGDIQQVVEVELRAPESIWSQLNNEDVVRAFVNLENLGEGEYQLEVQVEVGVQPVQILEIVPALINLSIEAYGEESFVVQPHFIGEPAQGFQPDTLVFDNNIVIVSGPQSLVNNVDRVEVVIDLSDVRETIVEVLVLRPLDADGQLVELVDLSPHAVTASQDIVQSGGYRDVVVQIQTVGLLSEGYRLTNMYVNPPTVTVYSGEPQLVADMPGFVLTHPLDLTEANDDFIARLALDLPEGVTLVGDVQSVEVFVSIAAIESSLTISLQVEILGLSPGLGATIAPERVDVFLSGPQPILAELAEEDIRVFVNLTDYEVGTHLIELNIEVVQDRVEVQAVTPASVDVVIVVADD